MYSKTVLINIYDNYYTQNFDELIDLALKGDLHNVDQYSNELNYDVTQNRDVANQDSEGDLYKSTENADPFLMFCFGKAASQHAKLGI